MKILFVCLGNICRSPTAEGVLRALVQRESFAGVSHIDSAGTAGYHIGDPPDRRSRDAARQRGYDLSQLRARQIDDRDFDAFDLLLAMDRANLRELQARAAGAHARKLWLFMDFAPAIVEREVPDPYYGGPADFERVIDLCETASLGLIAHLRDQPQRSL
jgi:protein-tyrosine phosphatase